MNPFSSESKSKASTLNNGSSKIKQISTLKFQIFVFPNLKIDFLKYLNQIYNSWMN